MPLLLIIPYIGTLWVSSYAAIRPEVWGIPFFYWYQFLWIAIGAVITIVVYLAESSADTKADARHQGDRS
jgi:membrane protein implicated in regulation of membrane protease activity